MKVSGIISALIFAQVALGQAADSSSVPSTSSVTGTKAAATGGKSHASSASSTASDATPTQPSVSSDQYTENLTGSTPLIPKDISATCSQFLNKFNSDIEVSKCLSPLKNALSVFTSGPGSAGAVSDVLTNLCQSTPCSRIPSMLTEFGTACTDDIASNKVVANQYNALFTLVPFQTSVCLKDETTQEYCILATGAQSSSSQNTRRSIAKRDQTVMNPEVFSSQAIPYLGAKPTMPQGQLCTSCTRQVMTQYFAFQRSHSHALGNTGISQSTLLGGQTALWKGMQDTCPAEFTAKILQDSNIAVELSGAVTKTASYFTTLVAAFAAAFTLF